MTASPNPDLALTSISIPYTATLASSSGQFVSSYALKLSSELTVASGKNLTIWSHFHRSHDYLIVLLLLAEWLLFSLCQSCENILRIDLLQLKKKKGNLRKILAT